jgi:hypothetical protein
LFSSLIFSPIKARFVTPACPPEKEFRAHAHHGYPEPRRDGGRFPIIGNSCGWHFQSLEIRDICGRAMRAFEIRLSRPAPM